MNDEIRAQMKAEKQAKKQFDEVFTRPANYESIARSCERGRKLWEQSHEKEEKPALCFEMKIIPTIPLNDEELYAYAQAFVHNIPYETPMSPLPPVPEVHYPKKYRKHHHEKAPESPRVIQLKLEIQQQKPDYDDNEGLLIPYH